MPPHLLQGLEKSIVRRYIMQRKRFLMNTGTDPGLKYGMEQ